MNLTFEILIKSGFKNHLCSLIECGATWKTIDSLSLQTSEHCKIVALTKSHVILKETYGFNNRKNSAKMVYSPLLLRNCFK